MAEGLIEEGLEEVVEVSSAGQLFSIGLGVGAVIGATVGYFFAKKKFAHQAEEEIAEMRTYFRHQQAATEARLKAPLTEVVEYLGYQKAEDQAEPSPIEKVEVARSLEKNVFDVQPDGEFVWDYATETKARSKGVPYVIHLDELGEGGFEVTHYTYYEGDEILADERDEPVDDVDNLVGLENLNRFGHGSDNINIVLVRNESISMDFEIAKSGGNYSEEVSGFIQHNYQIEKMPRRHPEFDDDQ
jgi:gas vesicle protein